MEGAEEAAPAAIVREICSEEVRPESTGRIAAAGRSSAGALRRCLGGGGGGTGSFYGTSSVGRPLTEYKQF